MHNNSYEGNDCIAEQAMELLVVTGFGKWLCVDGCIFLLYVNGDLATTRNEKGYFGGLSKEHFTLLTFIPFKLCVV